MKMILVRIRHTYTQLTVSTTILFT